MGLGKEGHGGQERLASQHLFIRGHMITKWSGAGDATLSHLVKVQPARVLQGGVSAFLSPYSHSVGKPLSSAHTQERKVGEIKLPEG